MNNHLLTAFLLLYTSCSNGQEVIQNSQMVAISQFVVELIENDTIESESSFLDDSFSSLNTHELRNFFLCEDLDGVIVNRYGDAWFDNVKTSLCPTDCQLDKAIISSSGRLRVVDHIPDTLCSFWQVSEPFKVDGVTYFRIKKSLRHRGLFTYYLVPVSDDGVKREEVCVSSFIHADAPLLRE